MTDDKLNMSLSANTVVAKPTNRFQWIRLKTSSTDKHYSLDSEDDFRSGCRNVSHQQQFFSELLTRTITQYEQRRGCKTQLSSLISDLASALDSREQFDIIILNFC